MGPDHRPWRRLVTIVAVVAATLAACGPSVTASPNSPTASPTASPVATEIGPTATTEPTPVPTVSGATPTPSPPSQSDTDRGRIWDALPASFPTYPGASPTEVGQGPASATLSLTSNPTEPAEVVAYYQTALTTAGFDPVVTSGPMEDGSYQVEASGPAGCAAWVTVARLGTDTVITILYGAECPFE